MRFVAVFLNLFLLTTAFDAKAHQFTELVQQESVVTQPMLWCIDNLPPRHYYTTEQELIGSMIGFMQELANHLDAELHYTAPTPIARCLQKLEQGKVDIVTGLMLTPERKQQFLMFPYDNARPHSWFINRHYPLSEVKMLRLTLIDTQIHAKEAAERFIAAGYQVNLVPDFDTALANLFFNQTDVLVGPEHITLKMIAQNGRYHNTLILAAQEYQQPIKAHLAINKQGRFSDQVETIQAFLNEIKNTGRYQFY
jgi:ABC-type amino acid transport substrate-binding protein